VNEPSGQTAFSSIATYAIAIALLCAPVLWNGFPLMFDDVGGYLERWPTGTLGQGRSAVYGLLLWISRGSSFVPVVLLQALVTTFVVDRALTLFAPRTPRSPWLLSVVIAAISMTSGVALFVSKILPDAWAAPAVLSLHLLAWYRDRLTRLECIAMAAIIAFAGASHMATFGVLAGLSVLNGIAWLARRKLQLAPTGIVNSTVAVWSGLALLLIVNVVVAGRLSLTPGGEVFLLGRMIEDGTADRTLREECPRADWHLCDFRTELPDYAEAFIFDANSPLQKIGGGNDPRARSEIASIILTSIRRHPIDHLGQAIALTARQFVDVGTGGAMEPLMAQHARWIFTLYAPKMIPAFDAARQQTGSVDVSRWSDWVVVPMSIVAAFALPALAVVLWRAGRRRDALLPAMLFLALLGNAAICGFTIGSSDRYQARLVWLAPLTIGLLMRSSLRREFGREAGFGVTGAGDGGAAASAHAGPSSVAT